MICYVWCCCFFTINERKITCECSCSTFLNSVKNCYFINHKVLPYFLDILIFSACARREGFSLSDRVFVCTFTHTRDHNHRACAWYDVKLIQPHVGIKHINVLDITWKSRRSRRCVNGRCSVCVHENRCKASRTCVNGTCRCLNGTCSVCVHENRCKASRTCAYLCSRRCVNACIAHVREWSVSWWYLDYYQPIIK